MSLRLWYVEASPPACAVRMLAGMIGLNLQLETVNVANMEYKSAEYKKRNPMGTIPTLQDGDLFISESHAIMMYLLRKYGKDHLDRLYPSEAKARALVDQAMYFDTGIAFIRLKMFALPSITGDMVGISPDITSQIKETYEITEQYLQKHRYIAADHLTIADLSLGTTINPLNAFVKVDAERFPRTVQWLEELQKETFFDKIAVPGALKLVAAINYSWERNKNKH